MKYSRFIGSFWFFISLGYGGFCQNTINLDIRIPDSFGESEEAMFRQLRLAKKIHLKYADLNPKIDQIIGFFENSGYPFIQVKLDSVNPAPEGISAILSVSPGELVTIDTVMNKTGYRISSPVLYRLMDVRPGDRYRESAIKEASGRLALVPYLSQTRTLEVGFHPGKASVYIYPEKAGANRFDGWIGLSPDLNSVGKLAVSGSLSLILNNVLGQGETWQFGWNRNQDRSQKLNLETHFPYLAGLPFGFQGKFDLYRQDTSYVNLGWDVGVPYHFSPNHLLNIFIRHRESNLIVASKDLQNSVRQPFTSLLTGLEWELNKLDNPVNPFRGLKFIIEVSAGRKSVPDSTPMQQSEIYASISGFQPLAKKLTCGIIIQSGYKISPETYENEQYRLGGLNLLRGFDEDVFHTDAFAVTSWELRYLLDRSSHLIFLADVGFLRIFEKSVPTMKIPAGVGLGGQIRTAGGIFRIIFALGKLPGQPLNLKNSKIHLGYVGVF